MFLDGAFAFSVEREVVVERGLREGQSLTEGQADELRLADAEYKCLSAAFRLLSYRPRSEMELRRRLQRRFDGGIVDRTIRRLEPKGMVDDAAFAAYWRENRDSFRPRSKKMLAQELRQKGVDAEVIRDTLRDINDEESAYRAALGKVRALEKDYSIFRHKLGAFLVRRGYSYDVVKRTVERLWRETNDLPLQ